VSLGLVRATSWKCDDSVTALKPLYCGLASARTQWFSLVR
jgi:hypothetical protein